MKCSPWWFLRLMTMILLNCVKAVFCVRCIFGSNSLNGVQLVPQGFPRWIGLQLDYIEWWVFPVFKPTYGLSKAVGLPFLSTTSSFLVHTLLKNLSRFYQVGCQDFEEVLAWAIGGWSQCKFQEACMAQCSLFPMIPHCMSLLATPTDLWLEGIFVPFNFTLDYPALKMLVRHERVLLKSSSCIQKRHNQVCSTACAGVGFYDWIQFISIKLSTVSIPWVISLRTALHKIGTRNGLMVKHDGKCCDFSFLLQKAKHFYFYFFWTERWTRRVW